MKPNVTFFSLVADDLNEVERVMRTQADGNLPDLKSALDLILSAGGKRVRPTLSLLIGRMLGAPQEPLITLAVAIELLHTATLVHDDLIDGSLLRRGMPTLNSRWSPGATVLTGDFLFARAAEKAAETNSIPLMKIFSHTLSVIVNGEITQMLSSKGSIDRSLYYQRIYAKTGSLFETSACSAAILSPVSDEVVKALGSFGKNIGIAFQIMDDILDFTGEQATLGKPIANDLRQGLITLPAIDFLEKNPQSRLTEMIKTGSLPDNEDEIKTIIAEIRRSGSIQNAHTEAVNLIKQSIDMLDLFPPSQEKSALVDLAHFIVDRKI
ncbi:MAG TPA: polyprenyl synthetase family protein [Anaerolineaceae bacterium]